LFECRSRTLAGELVPQEAAAFLSGLLVASDIAGAIAALGATPSVYLIGSPNLTRLYADGLDHHGLDPTHTIDGSAASLAGLAQIRRQLVTHGI
jgi:2-dehydro-3-deoxygalactonokinase